MIELKNMQDYLAHLKKQWKPHVLNYLRLLVQGNQKKTASLTAGFFLLIIVNLYTASGSGWHCQPKKSKKRIIDNRLRFKMLHKLLKRKVYFL